MIEFFSLSNKSFGLEITDVSVRLMKLARRRGKTTAMTVGYAEVPEGVIKDGDIKNEDQLVLIIKDAIAKSVGKKLKTKRVTMSLPDSKAFLQVIKMPKLTDGDLRAAVTFEAENYIPLPLEKVYLDFEKVAPAAGADGDTCEVLIVAFPRDAIDARVRVASKAGLVPVAMELESQAALRCLSIGRKIVSPSIIIQIGDTKTNLMVYSDNSIRFTFTIPISNRYFLETIANSAKVDMDVASVLKSRYGIEEFSNFPHGGRVVDPSDDADRRKIFEALIPGLVDFVQQAKKCIQYYQTHSNIKESGSDVFGKILICGLGSNLKGLDEFISLKLNSSAERIVSLIDDKSVAKKIDGISSREGLCGFSVAAGLAMRSLVENENMLKGNKIPEMLPAPRKIRGKRIQIKKR